jgi:hypothetical protein
MSCMPLFRPRTKATELAITIAKWTTGTGIHLHDNVVSHLRLHLAGKNLALLVMILVICIYIYYLYLLVIYVLLLCKQGPRRVAETYDMNMCSYRTARENLRTEDRLTLQSKQTHTDTLSAVYIINHHKVFSKT